MNVIGLFPTPVTHNYKRFTLDNSLLENLKYESNLGGNFFTTEQKILDYPEFQEIKNFIIENIEKYFNDIISADNITPYITNSWINLSKEGSQHHKHTHANSVLSGVYYLEADNKSDAITFYKSKYDQIKIYPKFYNLYNSDSWIIPVQTGDLLLFPSYFEHGVDVCKSKKRISLAFNVFVKGSLGSHESSTFLNI